MTWTDADEAAERARVTELMEDPDAVFVFGSNYAGLHGAGAALTAKRRYGARQWRGEGFQGRSYALPTKDAKLNTLPLDRIAEHVEFFREWVEYDSSTKFVVTRIGCGLAGYTDEEIAPLFFRWPVPANLCLPPLWYELGQPAAELQRTGTG